MDAKSGLDWFRAKIPVFNIIGKPILIDKTRFANVYSMLISIYKGMYSTAQVQCHTRICE